MDNSVFKTVLVAAGVCLVCGILVAASAVGLKDLQDKNAKLYMQRNILSAAGLYEEGVTDIEDKFSSVKSVLIDVDTGELANDKVASVEDYDQREAKGKEGMNLVVPSDEDIADIKVRAKYAKAYMVEGEAGELETLILPISGYGLWSTLYGFLALDKDLNTVKGLSFYEHAETPGLGGEVDNPKWKAQWLGKEIYDEDGQVAAKLQKILDLSRPYDKAHYVDSLSGATLTSNGVNNLIQYWMGEKGFKPFLTKLKAGEVN